MRQMRLRLSLLLGATLAMVAMTTVSVGAAHQPWTDPSVPHSWTGAGVTWPPSPSSEPVTFLFEHDGVHAGADMDVPTYCGSGKLTVGTETIWADEACLTLTGTGLYRGVAVTGDGVDLTGWWMDTSIPPCQSPVSLALGKFSLGGEVAGTAVGVEGAAHGAPYSAVCV